MRSDASNEGATPGCAEFVFSPGKTTEALDQLENRAEIDSESFRESKLIVVATGKPVETF